MCACVRISFYFNTEKSMLKEYIHGETQKSVSIPHGFVFLKIEPYNDPRCQLETWDGRDVNSVSQLFFFFILNAATTKASIDRKL